MDYWSGHGLQIRAILYENYFIYPSDRDCKSALSYTRTILYIRAIGNLLTINTPVREDYQLSEKATGRVNHVNVYDSEDPVQSNGGKTLIILPDDPSNKKGTGEYGSAGRKFENAKNINVDNPQGLIEGHMMGIYPGDFHNSHNRTKDWIKKTENK